MFSQEFKEFTESNYFIFEKEKDGAISYLFLKTSVKNIFLPFKCYKIINVC